MAAPASFDVDDIYREHAYLVRLTKGRNAQVQVFEVFGRPPGDHETESRPETVLRCTAPRALWDAISPELRSEFNRRLNADGKPAGRFGADDTAVQRLFGKELLVLLWAIEHPDVKPEEIAVAIRNWLGLKPEERWWLYTMTAAATGLAHHTGWGWRGALRQALCFGTRADAFNLGAVTGRGSLEPKAAAGAGRRGKAAQANGGTGPTAGDLAAAAAGGATGVKSRANAGKAGPKSRRRKMDAPDLLFAAPEAAE